MYFIIVVLVCWRSAWYQFWSFRQKWQNGIPNREPQEAYWQETFAQTGLQDCKNLYRTHGRDNKILQRPAYAQTANGKALWTNNQQPWWFLGSGHDCRPRNHPRHFILGFGALTAKHGSCEYSSISMPRLMWRWTGCLTGFAVGWPYPENTSHAETSIYPQKPRGSCTRMRLMMSSWADRFRPIQIRIQSKKAGPLLETAGLFIIIGIIFIIISSSNSKTADIIVVQWRICSS